jgi:SNF2 family DNA or RNA helicase
MRTLYPHQQEALAYAGSRSAIALYMQMRLGKSTVAMRWLKGIGASRVLLVAPGPTHYDWADEAAREAWGVLSLTELKKEQRVPAIVAQRRDDDILFTIHYEGLRVHPQLLNLDWDAIVLDESTRIRNPKAAITKLLIRKSAHIPNRALLSGEPAPEGPLDYFAQSCFLVGHFMGYDNFWAFRQKKMHQTFAAWAWSPNKGVNDEIRTFMHDMAFFKTRKQAGLASKTVKQRRMIELDPVQKRYLRELKKDLEIQDLDVSTKFTVATQAWMQKIAGGFAPDAAGTLISNAKTDELIRLLQGELKREKVVVWFNYNHELKHVFYELRKKGITCTRLSGQTPRAKRRGRIEKFRGTNYQVILVQLRLGLFGLDLSVADTAVYYSNSYEYEVRSQSIERIEHMRKIKAGVTTLVIDLVTKGTTDEDVVAALNDKQMTAKKFKQRLAIRTMERIRPGRAA